VRAEVEVNAERTELLGWFTRVPFLPVSR